MWNIFRLRVFEEPCEKIFIAVERNIERDIGVPLVHNVDLLRSDLAMHTGQA